MSTDLYPYTAPSVQNAPPLQIGGPPQSADASLTIYIQLAVFFILSVVSVVFFTSNTKEQEDTVEVLRRKISDLEDQLEILSETTKRQFASLDVEDLVEARISSCESKLTQTIHESMQAVKKEMEASIRERIASLPTGDLLEARIGSCESKLTQTIHESVQAVKKEFEGSVRERIAELEKKIPRPSRTVTVSLNDMQFYFMTNAPGPRRRPYATQWSNLQQPRLELTYAFIPVDTVIDMQQPPFTIPRIITDNQLKETITSPTLTRTIPAGQKLYIVHAAVWHSTAGIPNMADCTAQMKKLLEV